MNSLARRGTKADLCERSVVAETIYQQRRMGRDELLESVIVWAITEGRKVAGGMNKYLLAENLPRSQ